MLTGSMYEQHVGSAVARDRGQVKDRLIEHTISVGFANNDMLEEDAIENSRETGKRILSNSLGLFLAQLLDTIYVAIPPQADNADLVQPAFDQAIKNIGTMG